MDYCYYGKIQYLFLIHPCPLSARLDRVPLSQSLVSRWGAPWIGCKSIAEQTAMCQELFIWSLACLLGALGMNNVKRFETICCENALYKLNSIKFNHLALHVWEETDTDMWRTCKHHTQYRGWELNSWPMLWWCYVIKMLWCYPTWWLWMTTYCTRHE